MITKVACCDPLAAKPLTPSQTPPPGRHPPPCPPAPPLLLSPSDPSVTPPPCDPLGPSPRSDYSEFEDWRGGIHVPSDKRSLLAQSLQAALHGPDGAAAVRDLATEQPSPRKPRAERPPVGSGAVVECRG
jgi:hypothetical protein